MLSRRLVWLFAILALGCSLADVRVTLKLPLTKNDKRHLKVSKRTKPGEYTQYTIDTKKRVQMIRRVDFGKFTLFNTPDACDTVTKRRSVIVTLTAHGIFVRVKSNTDTGIVSEYFLCDTQTFFKLSDAGDYLRFVRPKEYYKYTHQFAFPAEMAVFVPVFEQGGEENVDYLGTQYDVEMTIKRKRALGLAKPPSPRTAITGIKYVRPYSFPFPQPEIYEHMKHYYAELSKSSEENYVHSSFREVNVTQPYRRLDCLNKTFATKYYINNLQELDKRFNNV